MIYPLIICSSLFFSSFALSFTIVSLFVDRIIFPQMDKYQENKLVIFYRKNIIDYDNSENFDCSNCDNEYFKDCIYEEDTPVGVVRMLYNPDTKNFEYYCDRFIPNKMLEVVCRGFVLKYKCCDLIVDYYDEGLKRIKVLDKVLQEKEKQRLENEKKEEETSDVFASFKSYNKKKNENTTSEKDILIKSNFNKFKNCGKLCDFIKTTNTEETKEEEIDCAFDFSAYKKKFS